MNLTEKQIKTIKVLAKWKEYGTLQINHAIKRHNSGYPKLELIRFLKDLNFLADISLDLETCSENCDLIMCRWEEARQGGQHIENFAHTLAETIEQLNLNKTEKEGA